MKLYLCGIKSYQLDLGLECTAFLDPRLERTLPGIKRDHNQPDHQPRTQLTRPHLLRILLQLHSTEYNEIVIRAAFTLASAGFLRVGEFTYRQSDLEQGLAFRNWFLTKRSINLTTRGKHLELNLPASKKDPFRHGIRLLIAATNDEACPVAAITRLTLIDTHRPPSASLLCIGRGEQLAFSREYVLQQLQGLAIRSGLGQGAWNGHSFRRGAATWAAEVGIPESQSQTLGRWKSDAYKRYIEYSTEERIILSQRFQRGLATI